MPRSRIKVPQGLVHGWIQAAMKQAKTDGVSFEDALKEVVKDAYVEERQMAEYGPHELAYADTKKYFETNKERFEGKEATEVREAANEVIPLYHTETALAEAREHERFNAIATEGGEDWSEQGATFEEAKTKEQEWPREGRGGRR